MNLESVSDKQIALALHKEPEVAVGTMGIG